MLNARPHKVEKFFDIIDESAMMINNNTKNSYLDCLCISIENILTNTINDEDIEEADILKLNSLYTLLESETFNKEELRKAFQLALLKGFKHLNVSISDITPDSIGILFAYFVDLFFMSKDNLSILDGAVGTGNLLITMLNNCTSRFSNIFGVDTNYEYMKLALNLAQLTDYNIEFFQQNSIGNLLCPQQDLVVADLPYDENLQEIENNLLTIKNNITYKPYLIMENLMKYAKPGGYFIYLIPNDFFNKTNNSLMKEIILSNTYIQAIIQLPLSMFSNEKAQKAILILRKKGENILPTKEILLLDFPSFSEVNNVKNALEKINKWFKNINK